MAAPYPFLFYGHAPADFAEGANMGHFWEIRFVRPGSDDELREVATAWADALAGSPVATVDWHFAGAWALVRCGEDEASGEDHYPRFFAAIAQAMRAVHEVLPIAEVVFGNGRGAGVGPWDRWSHQQQAWPSPYPEFEDYTRFYGTDHPDYVEQFGDPALGTGARNAAFDQALSAPRKRRAKKMAKKKAGVAYQPVDQSVVDRLSAQERAAWAPMNERLEALGAAKARPRMRAPSGRVVTWIETGPLEQRLSYADPEDTALRTPDLPVFKGRIDAKLSPDAARLAVIQVNNQIVTTSATDGSGEAIVFRAQDRRGLKDAAWLSPQRLIVVADDALHLVDLGGATPTVICSVEVKRPSRVWACRGGTVVVLSRNDERSEVWAVQGDVLAKLAEGKGEISSAIESDGEIYVSGSPYCRLEGLPPA